MHAPSKKAEPMNAGAEKSAVPKVNGKRIKDQTMEKSGGRTASRYENVFIKKRAATEAIKNTAKAAAPANIPVRKSQIPQPVIKASILNGKDSTLIAAARHIVVPWQIAKTGFRNILAIIRENVEKSASIPAAE